MRQYLYVSTADSLTADEVADLLQVCQRNNGERALTGLLLYNGRNFLQLLEGEDESLAWTMQRIERDSRHHGISRLYDETVGTRSCPEWSMKRIALGDSGEARRERLEAELPTTLDAHLRRMILNFALLN